LGVFISLLQLARSPGALYVGSALVPAAMKNVPISELRFCGLRDNVVAIGSYFQDYALLVFLRHLA
jgi:hypothetical protein